MAGLASSPLSPAKARAANATTSRARAMEKGGETIFQESVPGARGQPHVTLHGGHFLQEDCPSEIAELIDAFIYNR
jgi:pimeloyl-ACP methyl ester carboxylesterase